MIGGTVSKLSGGSFANGAVTGAFSRVFGESARRSREGRGRALHKDEIALGKEAFRRAFGSDEGFDYATVRVIDGKFVPWQPNNVAITPNGNIYYPEDCGNLTVCGGESVAALFVHELTHVYQYQQVVNVFSNGLILQSSADSDMSMKSTYEKRAGDREATVPTQRWENIELTCLRVTCIVQIG